MRSFGVLAVASLCLARPEADPAILLTHPADAHPPLVKSVVEVPAEVTHEVVAHPFFHHAPLVHHAAPLVHHAAPVAPSHGAVHQVTPFVDLGRKKREAKAEADAEAAPYAHYGSFVPDALPHHPVVATVHARAHHGFGYYGYPYGGYYHGFAGHYFG